MVGNMKGKGPGKGRRCSWNTEKTYRTKTIEVLLLCINTGPMLVRFCCAVPFGNKPGMKRPPGFFCITRMLSSVSV